jgi:hypothetical protein
MIRFPEEEEAVLEIAALKAEEQAAIAEFHALREQEEAAE